MVTTATKDVKPQKELLTDERSLETLMIILQNEQVLSRTPVKIQGNKDVSCTVDFKSFSKNAYWVFGGT